MFKSTKYLKEHVRDQLFKVHKTLYPAAPGADARSRYLLDMAGSGAGLIAYRHIADPKSFLCTPDSASTAPSLSLTYLSRGLRQQLTYERGPPCL